jgi:hypothetical protein
VPLSLRQSTIHFSVLAYASLNVLPRFSSSSEYDTKRVRRMKNAKMQDPMTSEGIVEPPVPHLEFTVSTFTCEIAIIFKSIICAYFTRLVLSSRPPFLKFYCSSC